MLSDSQRSSRVKMKLGQRAPRLTEAAAVTTDSRLISFPFLIPRRRCCLEYSFLLKRPLSETWTLLQFFLTTATAAPPDHRNHDGVKPHLWRWRQQLWAPEEGGSVISVHVQWWILWSFSSPHLILLLAQTACIYNTFYLGFDRWSLGLVLEVLFSYYKDFQRFQRFPKLFSHLKYGGAVHVYKDVFFSLW